MNYIFNYLSKNFSEVSIPLIKVGLFLYQDFLNEFGSAMV